MEREVKNGLRNQVKGATFDALVAANEVELPSAMVAQEIDRQRQQMINSSLNSSVLKARKHLIQACFQMTCSKNKLRNQLNLAYW